MFLRQMSIEIRKTVKQPALWMGLAALLALLSLFTLIHHSQIKYGLIPVSGGLEKDLLAGLSFYNWIGGFIYAVTASVVIAYDYADLRLWLSRGVSRSSLLFARLTVILLVAGVMICISILAMLVLAVLSRNWFFGTVEMSDLDTTAILPILLRIFWSSLPYLSLTVLLAVISRSYVFAAAAGIVYVDILERLLLSLSERYPLLTRYLPGQLSLVLQSGNSLLDRTAEHLLDTRRMTEPAAALSIAILFLCTTTFAFFIFSRQDLGASQ